MPQHDDAVAWVAFKLRAIAQYGLTDSRDPHDLERFGQLDEIAAEMAAQLTISRTSPPARNLRP